MITRDDIHRAYDTIRPYLRRTPVVQLDLDGPVTLKLEQLQCAGSFKARGAFTNLLLRNVPPAGVAAASGGNHGVAVAYAAHRLTVPARIFVPTVASPAKIDRIRQLADLVAGGDRYADALEAANQWITASGAMSVPAYDGRETILGQATLALELDDQAGPLDTVLVPVGGGGLIAGVASYFAGTARVIGVEPDGAPTLARARAAGAPVDAPAGSIAVDALAPRRVGELVFPITQAYVEDVVLVDDDAIRGAQACCGRPRASRPSRPPRSASRRYSPARTSPRPASASPSSSAAPTCRRRNWTAEQPSARDTEEERPCPPHPGFDSGRPARVTGPPSRHCTPTAGSGITAAFYAARGGACVERREVARRAATPPGSTASR